MGETSLEEVFLFFARKQKTDDKDDKGDEGTDEENVSIA